MQIQSSSYQFRTVDTDIFTKQHSNEFPVRFVKGDGDRIVFASRNEVFSKLNGDVKKLAGFDSDVTHLSVQDGLVCCGTVSGGVHLLGDYRKCIRSYTEHAAAVTGIRVVACPKMGRVIVSCSDDATVRSYMIQDEKSFHTFSLGDECAKSIDVQDERLFVGTSDLSIFSLKSGERTYTHSNGAAVTKVHALDADNIVFAHKNKISILNTSSGSVATRVAHTKPVANMTVYGGVIYTAAADGHLRSWTTALKKISDFNLRGKITDFDISDDRPLIALESGDILGVSKERAPRERAFAQPKRPGYEEDIEFEVVPPSKKRLTEIDALFQRYEYKACLRIIMERNDIGLSYTVLQRLQELRALKKALADENAEFLEQFLNLCIDHFAIKEFNGILVECLIIITTIYSELILENENIKELIDIVRESIDEEVVFQELCLKSIAFLDCFQSDSAI
ncbi:U3 small nucleolar RNA-associated protein 15 [Pancytospora philotis]|nr:U3 small nucleolar RNA-associated protein 15 [Pancytospora philotis]